MSGDVFAQSETLRLAPSARIGGKLVYASMNELVRDPGASVAGAIEHQEARVNPAMRRFALAVRWGRSFVGLLAPGLLWRFLTPRWTERTEAALVADPWRSLATGLGALLLGAEVVTVLGERRHRRDQRPLVPAAAGRVG